MTVADRRAQLNRISAYDYSTTIADSGGIALGMIDDVLEDLRKVVSGIEDRVVAAIKPLLANLSSAISGIGDNIERTIRYAVGLLGSMTDDIVETLYGYYDALLSTIESVMLSLRSSIEQLIRDVVAKYDSITASIQTALRNVTSALSDMLERTLLTLSNTIRTLVTRIDDIVTSVYDSITTAVERLRSGIERAYQTTADAISAALREIMERIRDALLKIMETISTLWDKASDYVNEQIVGRIDDSWKSIREVMSIKGNVIVRAITGGYTSYDAFVADLADPPPIIGAAAALIGGLVMTMVVMPGLSAVVEPAIAQIANLAREKFRPAILDAATLTEAFRRGNVTDDYHYTELALSGYDDTSINVLKQLSRTLLSPDDARVLYVRGLISRADHDTILRQHGYAESDIDLLVSTYSAMPSPSDIVRMAVREVFTPETATRYGLYEDIPDDYFSWARRVGLSPEVAKLYWAAHWELPSPQMGYEMLHRGIISLDQLKELLRALDVMPYWRDKLVALSYEPYTRVDIRRMYQTGALSYDEVIKAYKDIGYDDEKAKRLADWTATHYALSEKTDIDEYRTLSAQTYQAAYKRGIITRDEYISYLTILGYRREDAELMVAISDADKAISDIPDEDIPRKAQLTNLFLTAYTSGVITSVELRSALSALGYSDFEVDWLQYSSDYAISADMRKRQIDTIREWFVTRTIDDKTAHSLLGTVQASVSEHERLISSWSIDREARTRKPTEAQLRAALQRGILTIDEYADELRGLGYHERYVQMLVKLAKG